MEALVDTDHFFQVCSSFGQIVYQFSIFFSQYESRIATYIYSTILSDYLFRRKRSTLEEDINMVSILESIEDVHKILNRMNEETTSIDYIDPKDICRIKWSLCHMKQYNKYFVTPDTNIGRKHNLILFEKILNDIRLVLYDVPYTSVHINHPKRICISRTPSHILWQMF